MRIEYPNNKLCNNLHHQFANYKNTITKNINTPTVQTIEETKQNEKRNTNKKNKK
jgi:hypothetical protein